MNEIPTISLAWPLLDGKEEDSLLEWAARVRLGKDRLSGKLVQIYQHSLFSSYCIPSAIDSVNKGGFG